jgi:uncharacterized protein YdhG (YjbR/CyaY superfamily)
MESTAFSTVDEYIESFSPAIQAKLKEIREYILKTLPELTESISYGMPAYKYKKKPIIYYAAHLNHLGIYALPNAHEHFKERLAKYKQGKGSIQISYAKPIPLKLVGELMHFNLYQLLQ